MKHYLVTFRSITYAQRGERAVKGSGLSCTLQRTPRWMEEQGCGYSLVLRQADAQNAVEILRRKQIPFRKVYLRGEQGEVVEVSL